MFLLFGHRATKIAEETVRVNEAGDLRPAVVQVFQRYAHLFWIPIFPLYRNYLLYFPDTGATYTKTLFQSMPPEYLEACKKVPARTPWWTFIGILLFGLLIYWLEKT